MSEAEIKLPTSSFEEVSKIIQAYAHANKPASLLDISKRTGINTTIISGNNAFLLSIGVISDGKSKEVTTVGKQLGDAMSHGLDEEVSKILRGLVEENEFLKNLLGAVRIRKGMEESALKSHIAYSAGQNKSGSVMTGAGTVIELLRRASLLEEMDGKFVTVTLRSELVPMGEKESPKGGESNVSIQRFEGELTGLKVQGSSGGVRLTIEVRINATPDQLDGLGRKLRDVVDEFENNGHEE